MKRGDTVEKEAPSAGALGLWLILWARRPWLAKSRWLSVKSAKSSASKFLFGGGGGSRSGTNCFLSCCQRWSPSKRLGPPQVLPFCTLASRLLLTPEPWPPSLYPGAKWTRVFRQSVMHVPPWSQQGSWRALGDQISGIGPYHLCHCAGGRLRSREAE